MLPPDSLPTPLTLKCVPSVNVVVTPVDVVLVTVRCDELVILNGKAKLVAELFPATVILLTAEATVISGSPSVSGSQSSVPWIEPGGAHSIRTSAPGIGRACPIRGAAPQVGVDDRQVGFDRQVWFTNLPGADTHCLGPSRPDSRPRTQSPRSSPSCSPLNTS